MTRRASALPALALIAAACSGAEQRVSWHDDRGFRWRELEVAGGRPGFTDVGRRAGIRFTNTVSESALVGNRMLGQGAGIALGDVDGDGMVDVFLARTEGASALYRNRGGWRFEDVTRQAGVAAADRHSSGAAFVDIDGDRDLDLVLIATLGPNAIFLNDGSGRFTERRDLGVDTTGSGGTTVSMADVDRDGDLDLYVANYKAYSPTDRVSPQQRAFNQLVRQVGPGRFEVVGENARDFKIVMRPDMGGLNLTMRGEPDEFYLNAGGRFTRVPLTSDRFRDAQGRPLTEKEESFTLAARFADLNDDGAADLYVANDFEDLDQLWFNDGRGSFRLADWTALRQMSNSSMGVDVGDVNGDARPDLFVVDMLSNDARRLKTQIPAHTALPKRAGDMESQLQQQRNTLFLNRGDGTFAEAGFLAGVHASGWSWSTMFLDVDLDGWQDILIANGHLWDLMDADTQERLQKGLADVNWQRQRWEFPKLLLENVAFRNRGDGTFEDAGDAWRFGVEPDISHTLASGDLDGDGDSDVVVNRLGAPALVLRNDAHAPRVAVRLVGEPPNTRAVGAKIRLLGGATPVQEREVAVGGLYMSHSDYQAAFAMGGANSASLVVDWPDGRRTTIDDVRPNRLYEVTAATAQPRAPADTGRRSAKAPLFQDVTSALGGHVHADPPFDDWQRQLLLPNSLSQLGPGVSWFDYDRDGDEDLLIGAGRGGRLGVFRNDDGRLSLQRAQGPVAPADFTTILGLTAAGTARLLVGASSWEGPPVRGVPTVPSVVSAPVSGGAVMSTASPLFPPQESATGPMALGDYDRDGDLDLFVGGQALPGRYPQSASSRLYRNESGNFSLDSAHVAVLNGVDLVSAAIFADIDGDSDPDLVLAREWDSILLLINDGGRLAPAPDSWGLGRWTSRWNGIAAGDLNGDGRLDLVATSWGRNTVTPADSTRPLVLVHGPFGSAGGHELLLARHDARLRGLAPLNSYPRLRVTIPGLSSRVASFAAYADATVDRVLGPSMSKAQLKPIVTLDHMLFINSGNRFEAKPLPVEAQLTPAFYAGVADFDGDGFEDVFLSQNFFPTAVGLPRYDAGRGLVLEGDGKGGLRPMPGAHSGILVHGDQRGAAYSDFDGDGRLDLALSQNGAATRLFRNRGAQPGLRVRVQGPPSNPDGIGAQVRVVYGSQLGAVREVHAGSGYWSQDGAVQVFGLLSTPTAVMVRWPGAGESRVPVKPGTLEVIASQGSPAPSH